MKYVKINSRSQMVPTNHPGIKKRSRQWLRSRQVLIGILGAATLAGLSVSSDAVASNITFSVINPHEYALPLEFKPFNVFVQYGEYQMGGTSFDSSGNTTNVVPADKSFVGLSKFVHFWSYASIPWLGLAYEVILPEVHVWGNGTSATGIQGPLTGPALWIKPTSNSTLGFQSFLQVPVGTSQVSNNYWSLNSSIFWDVQLGDVNIDGDAGGVVNSDQHAGGQNTSIGSTTFANLRVAYRFTDLFEPFFAVDWQNVRSNSVSNMTVPNTYSREVALGGGIRAQFNPKISLAVHYSRGVTGANTPRSNELYFEYIYLF